MCCLIVAPAVWGQTANSSAKPGILGYLDPNTGAFRPVPAAEETTDALTNDIRWDYNRFVRNNGEIHRTYQRQLHHRGFGARCDNEQSALLWRERHCSRHREWDHKDMQGNAALRLGPRNPSQRQYDDQLLRNWGWFSFRAGSEEQYSLSTGHA
jgi:hypothetical protein